MKTKRKNKVNKKLIEELSELNFLAIYNLTMARIKDAKKLVKNQKKAI